MTRPFKKYRVVWIDANNKQLVSVDNKSLEEALADASECLMLIQESLKPHEQIHKPLRRVLYRLDSRQHQGIENANKKVVNQ